MLDAAAGATLRKRLAAMAVGGSAALEEPCIAPEALKSLLGREYHARLFDARAGLMWPPLPR
jgi:tRNA(Met) cytidine acetyltransferase